MTWTLVIQRRRGQPIHEYYATREEAAEARDYAMMTERDDTTVKIVRETRQ